MFPTSKVAIPSPDRRRQPVPLRVVEQPHDLKAHNLRSLVEFDSVTKAFESRGRDGVVAVSEISLTVHENAATLVTGASGSGKTTLLSLIGCMVRPTAGRVLIDGRDVSRLPEEMLTEIRRRFFGLVFQNALLVRGMSAVNNVMLPALPRSDVGSGLVGKARDLLARFGLADRARERVECLSGGEQQRVAIARALINDPEVLLADEPTAHLGSKDTRDVLDLFAELGSEGRTVVVASHDQEVITSEQFNQVLELHGGRLGNDGG